MTEYELHTQGGVIAMSPKYDGRDPMRNRPYSNGTDTTMTIKRYGLDRDYSNNIGVPAIKEMADGAYVRYEDFQRMEAGHNAMHELLALRTRKAEAALVAAKVRDWPKIQAHIKEYVDGYELIGEDDQGRDGCHTPTAGERALIEDAIHGLLGEPDFDTLYHPQPAGPLIEVMDGGLLQDFLDAAKKDGITHLAFAQSAEPAKVLSDADVAELARAHNISSASRGIRAHSDIIDFTRALLARYSNAIQPDPAMAGDDLSDAEVVDLAVDHFGIDADRMPYNVVNFARALLKRVQPPSGEDA